MARAYLRDSNVYVGPRGAVTASPGIIKVQGVLRTGARPRTPTRDDQGPAVRTLVSSYHGSSYVAEREGETLNIYLITAGPVSTETYGAPASSATGDRGGMSAARMQKINEESRNAR